MTDTRFVITPHAVDRYVKRYAVGATFEQGQRDLEHMLSTAVPLKTKSIKGQELWRCAEPPTIFVVKPDAGKIVCVTVLPQTAKECDLQQSAAIENADEVLAAYERVKPLIEKAATKAECSQSLAGWRGKAERSCVQLRNELVAAKAKREQVRRDAIAILNFCETGDVKKLENAHDMPSLSGKVTKVTTAAEIKKATDFRNDQSHCGALERKLERQIEHGKRMSNERQEAQSLLAVAIQGLQLAQAGSGTLSSSAALSALRKIELVNPQFLEKEFWNREIILKGVK